MLKQITIKKISIFLLVFAFGVILKQITQISPSPEESKNLWVALPAFVVFIVFVYSSLSWGSFIRKFVKVNTESEIQKTFFDLTIGSVFYYVLSYALTPLGLFSVKASIFLWMILSLGIAIGEPIRIKLQQQFGWFVFIPLLVVIIRLLEGLQFHQHGDAYITYLPAPRIWAETGNFNYFKEYSQFFLSTSFESLFAWGTALMGLTSGRGLDVSQWFSQWCSAGIGVFGLVIGSLAIGEKLAKKFYIKNIWIPFVALMAIQIPVLRWMSNIAKNDLGVAFWGLSGFCFSVLFPQFLPVPIFLVGLIMGAAAIGKLTISILAILIFIPILYSSKSKSIFYVLGGVMGALPVMLRNWILMRNPVYPWLPTIFPDPNLKGSVLLGSEHATTQNFEWSQFEFYLLELYDQVPLIGVFIIFLFLGEKRKVFKKIWLPICSFILFTITLRASTEIRYQGPTLVLIMIFSTYFSFYFFEKYGKKMDDWSFGNHFSRHSKY
jgi:hypothetical protein